MAALVAIQSGAIRLGERDVAALDPRDRARRIGYLPQDAAIHWNVSARDVIALGRAQHHAPFAGHSEDDQDRKSTRLYSSHSCAPHMPPPALQQKIETAYI